MYPWTVDSWAQFLCGVFCSIWAISISIINKQLKLKWRSAARLSTDTWAWIVSGFWRLTEFRSPPASDNGLIWELFLLPLTRWRKPPPRNSETKTIYRMASTKSRHFACMIDQRGPCYARIHNGCIGKHKQKNQHSPQAIQCWLSKSVFCE